MYGIFGVVHWIIEHISPNNRFSVDLIDAADEERPKPPIDPSYICSITSPSFMKGDLDFRFS